MSPLDKDNNGLSNHAFSTKEEAQQYLSSISPPRDLVCPITQEICNNPVVASDGNTYEKQAIQTWFDAQRNSTGSIRSPVTNAYMDLEASGTMLVENKAVVGMARNHREKLGEELCLRCQAVRDEAPGSLGDEGFRIKGLIEAGADLALKGCAGGNTAFMSLLLSNFEQHNVGVKFDLLNYFLVHNVPVSLVNDEGKNCIEHTEELIAAASDRDRSAATPYHQLLEQLQQRSKIELERKRAQSEARNEYNSEERERQRVLTENARNHDTVDEDGVLVGNMLGRMENGWGFFPCLAALQFQGNIPEAPASFLEEENREKKKLKLILRSASLIVFVFFLVS